MKLIALMPPLTSLNVCKSVILETWDKTCPAIVTAIRLKNKKLFSIVNVMGINNRMYLTQLYHSIKFLSLLCEIYDTYCLLTTSKTVCPQRRVQSFICYKMDKNVFFNDEKDLVLWKATINNISY